mmetsp:Transcript_52669/g.90571  ORF Transcript_52669/g.90571 Transcript_52669/m.90571 type:complete len:201 (+) Transcript_52669:1080-1682(+)
MVASLRLAPAGRWGVSSSPSTTVLAPPPPLPAAAAPCSQLASSPRCPFHRRPFLPSSVSRWSLVALSRTSAVLANCASKAERGGCGLPSRQKLMRRLYEPATTHFWSGAKAAAHTPSLNPGKMKMGCPLSRSTTSTRLSTPPYTTARESGLNPSARVFILSGSMGSSRTSPGELRSMTSTFWCPPQASIIWSGENLATRG